MTDLPDEVSLVPSTTVERLIAAYYAAVPMFARSRGHWRMPVHVLRAAIRETPDCADLRDMTDDQLREHCARARATILGRPIVLVDDPDADPVLVDERHPAYGQARILGVSPLEYARQQITSASAATRRDPVDTGQVLDHLRAAIAALKREHDTPTDQDPTAR